MAKPEDKGCGKMHTSMLDWQKCPLCRTLPQYDAYARSPRAAEPPPPPKPPEPEGT